MKKFRLSVALLVLALVLLSVSAVFAQDTTLGASQGDYDLWTAANANLATLTTGSYNFTLNLATTGMSDPTSNVKADLKGSGVFDTNKDNPAFQMDVTGTVVQGTDTTQVNLGVRIVDGVVYWNTGDDKGWQGSKLSDLSSEISGMAGGMTGGAVPSGDLSSLEGSSGMADAMKGLEGLQPATFMTLTRTDENGVAHFSLNLDVAKLLASPALGPMIAGMMASSTSASGSSSTKMSDAQIQQMQGMVGAMFAQAKITFDEWVSPDDKTVQRASLNLSIPLDTMMGPGAGVTCSFDITLTDAGKPVTVEAPEGATIVDMSATPSS